MSRKRLIMLLSAIAVTVAPGCRSNQGTPAADDGQKVTIDEAFWHSGWKVELASATLNPETPAVTFEGTFENLGEATAEFNSQLIIEQADRKYDKRAAGDQVPFVSGGGVQEGSFGIVVDGNFNFDQAILVVGKAGNQQARVPLGGAGELISLEPQRMDVQGQAVAGRLVLDLSEVEIRTDLPDIHNTTKAGQRVMVVRFFATDTRPAGTASSHNLQSQNLALKLPNGTTLAVRSDGRSAPNVLVTSAMAKSVLTARFDITDPVAGSYALVVQGPYADAGGAAAGEVRFQIPEG